MTSHDVEFLVDFRRRGTGARRGDRQANLRARDNRFAGTGHWRQAIALIEGGRRAGIAQVVPHDVAPATHHAGAERVLARRLLRVSGEF